MVKNVIIFILLIVVIGSAIYFFGPQFGINFFKKPFDAEKVASGIFLSVGESMITSNLICAGISQTLSSLSSNFSCQQNRHSASESKERIEEIMSQYNVRPLSDWDISQAGFGRNYQSGDGASYQSITILVSNDIVALSYDKLSD
jgi:hypothetical protein